MNRRLPDMTDVRRTGWVLSAAMIVCAALAGCLTPGQTVRVSEQLDEIRQQTEQVRSTQQQIAETIGGIEPVERTAVGRSIDDPRDLVGAGSLRDADAAIVEDDLGSGRVAADRSPSAADEGLFREGYALYHRRDYQGAEQHMRRFLDSDPRGSMADDAQFWIGECRFARGLYRDAIFEYRDVIEHYPASYRVPRAWYMIALSYERLGEQAAMNEYLEIVVEQFPESDVAPLARDRLGIL